MHIHSRWYKNCVATSEAVHVHTGTCLLPGVLVASCENLKEYNDAKKHTSSIHTQFFHTNCLQGVLLKISDKY